MTCGAAAPGRYCAECGESTGHRDYALTHFVEELVESVTHLDGRVFASFRSLLTRPGALTRDFLLGRRKKQFGPVQFFVICNVVYFFLQPFSLFVPFTSTLHIQTHERAWSGIATQMVDAKLAERNVTLEDYSRTYDEAAHLQGKTLVMIMVPLFALGAWAVHGRTRRFYAEHLVYSFYTYAFVLVWMGVITVVLSKIFLLAWHYGWRPTGEWLDDVSTPIVVLPVVVYLLVSDRVAYGESWLATIVKAGLLTGWMIAVMETYRFILFFTVFYAT